MDAGRDAATTEPVGDLSDELGGLGGDGFGGLARAEGFGVGEECAEDVEVLGFGEAGQVESVDALGGAGEVGVDFEAVEVADDQERWVFEVFTVLEQLFVGGGEVFVFAFVFPAEVIVHPDVGPAVAAVGFMDAAFESVPGAVGVGFGGFGLAEELAQVEEVLLASAAFGEISGLPFVDKFVGRHAQVRLCQTKGLYQCQAEPDQHYGEYSRERASV